MMPNSDLKVLGEKVRKERKLAGLTQEQLAERCHQVLRYIGIVSQQLLRILGQAVAAARCQVLDNIFHKFLF